MKTWWTRWSEIIYKLIAFAASVGSLLWLAIPHLPSLGQLSKIEVVLVVLSAIAFMAVCILEFKSSRKHRLFALKDKLGIRKYLHNWIEHGGRVAIWTRDISWAENNETKRLLEAKAKAHELIICLPQSIPLTDDLQKKGAEIYAYGNAYSSPASRFTITFFERDGAQVAIGRVVGNHHIIDEFNSGTHPAFHIAEDLVRFAKSVSNDNR